MSQQFNRLGSAKSGAHHWLAQRGSALFMLYLNAWLLCAICVFAQLPYEQIIAKLASPITAAHALFYVCTAAYHAQLGLQVVIEDYVQCRYAKTLLLVGVKFVACALAIITLTSLIKIMILAGASS